MSFEDSNECFYCGGPTPKSGEGDHFPIPKELGGKETVPCCVSCHNAKDRISFDNWTASWIGSVLSDFPKLSVPTRLFLAKSVRLFLLASHTIKRNQK